jgi:hypothetical protein
METATQTLHKLTSGGPFVEETESDPPVADPRVLMDLVVDDITRLPYFYKQYPESLPRLALPRELPPTTAATVDVLAGTADVPPGTLDIAQLARLLFLAAGVVRTMQRPYGTFLFRAAGSAGGRFPMELYVAVPESGRLPAGVHWYDPRDHQLVLVGPPPSGEVPALIVTGVPWRTGWRYRERGYRHVYWDSGTMLSQFLAAADSAGLPTQLYTRFHDAQVGVLVGSDGVHEWPVAVVALGDGLPALEASGSAVTGDVDIAPVEFPLVTAAQRAGDREGLGRAWDPGLPVDVSLHGGAPVEDVVLSRGSQRLMDASASLSAEFLETAMTVAMRGVDVEHWIGVNNVAGMRPGIYRWPGLATPLRDGDPRDDLYHVCVDQALGRDAAFVVISTTDVSALDDREYREAQLASGIVEGRLHLLAYALGASASGMTFSDSLLPDLMGQVVDGLLVTCVGTPEYKSARAGGPGAPAEVRRVTPRF